MEHKDIVGIDQLSCYVLASRLAKRNGGQVALAFIEEVYGDELADSMYSFMQWPEANEWFGKSTCETGIMYYLKSEWIDCTTAAIRADMKKTLSSH